MSKVNVPIAFLSLVTSVLLWASVYSSSIPKFEKKDVVAPLQPGNLDQRRFVITEIPTEMTLTLTGNRDQLKTVSPYAIVDLSMATPGNNSYPVVIFPASVRELLLTNGLTTRIKIVALTKKIFEVKGVYNGVSPDGRLAESLDIFPKKVYVTGPEEAVARVATVQVLVDYSAAAVSTEGIEVEAKALDSAGQEVPRLVLRTSDSHPEYTDDAIKEPATIRVHLKLATPDTATKPPFKLP